MEAHPRVGRYELLEQIEQGGLGVLYRGRDTVLGRDVAVKVMAAGFQGEEAAKARFFREAKAAARLQHPNVVTVFEFGEHDETPFIVMEFLRGRSLAERLRDGPPLSLREKLDVAIQLCAGLEAAHTQGVVHRDVKPENVWLCLDGTVKLLDFGIATAASASATFIDVLASPGYMSPEQIAGRPVDGRTDIFSVGVVLYEMLTGRCPFEADSPTGVMLRIVNDAPPAISDSELPRALTAAVMRAIEKSPDARYTRASELGRDLKAVRADLAVPLDSGTLLLEPTLVHAAESTSSQPAPESVPPRAALRERLRQLPPQIAWGAAGLLVLLVALAWYALASSDAPAARTIGAGTSNAGDAPPPRPAAAPTDAPTPQPAPIVSPLTVTSAPLGARILLDGKDSGEVTPADIQVDPSQPPRIQLELAGHQPQSVAVTPEILRAGRLEVPLSPRAAAPRVRLVATGDYPFEIVNGPKVLSPESERHEVVVSNLRSVQLRADQYFLNQSVRVDRTEPGTVRAAVPPLGRISVYTGRGLESCQVLIDDRTVEGTPVANRDIASGRHMVKLRCAAGDTDTQTVIVSPQASVSARFPADTPLRPR